MYIVEIKKNSAPEDLFQRRVADGLIKMYNYAIYRPQTFFEPLSAAGCDDKCAILIP